jgi:RNA polymerase sigma factor (sigma-70 family)
MSGIGAVAGVATVEDTGLVAAVRQGDDRAFEELYGRYHSRIAAYVRGMVKDHARAEDVTQEVFFSALRRMRQTERPIAFKPWIYEIARNACIDSYRRTSRAEELSYDANGGLGTADTMRLVSSTPGPDDAVESKQRLDDLCGAFGGLSETHHQILVLRELEGLSYREIGERLGMSRAAVESTLFRARRRLTEEYDELVSGRRCQRVQAIIADAAQGMLGTRDRRRLDRHVTSCHACRRQAFHLGVEVGERPSVAARIAGLLPFPFPYVFLRGRGSGGGAAASASGTGLVAQASATLGGAGEPLAAAWSKGVAAVATQGVPVPGLERLSGDAAGSGAAVAAPAGRARALSGAVAVQRVTERSTRPPRAAQRPAAAEVRGTSATATARTGAASADSPTILPTGGGVPRLPVAPVSPPASNPSGGAAPANPGASQGTKVPLPLNDGDAPKQSPTGPDPSAEPSPAATTVRAVEAATDQGE